MYFSITGKPNKKVKRMYITTKIRGRKIGEIIKKYNENGKLTEYFYQTFNSKTIRNRININYFYNKKNELIRLEEHEEKRLFDREYPYTVKTSVEKYEYDITGRKIFSDKIKKVVETKSDNPKDVKTHTIHSQYNAFVNQDDLVKLTISFYSDTEKKLLDESSAISTYDTIYEYYANRQVKVITVMDIKNKAIKEETKYNRNGNITDYKYFSNGSLLFSILYKYNENGLLEYMYHFRHKYISSSNFLTQTTHYEYDENHNVICKTVTHHKKMKDEVIEYKINRDNKNLTIVEIYKDLKLIGKEEYVKDKDGDYTEVRIYKLSKKTGKFFLSEKTEIVYV